MQTQLNLYKPMQNRKEKEAEVTARLQKEQKEKQRKILDFIA